MSRALFTTRLKVSDPTAMTAEATLRRRFGFGDGWPASRARNCSWWIDPRPATLRDALQALIRRTNLFMNPNKHVGRLVVEGEEAAAGARAARVGGAGGAAGGFLLVWTPGDGDDLLESVQQHAGVDGFAALSRGWLWRFTAGPGVDSAGLLVMARQSGELRSRGQGFLVHPAYQEHRLYATRPSLYDIGSVTRPDPDTRHLQESRP